MISSQLTKTTTHPLEDIKKFYEKKLQHFEHLLEAIKENPPKPGQIERINAKIALFKEALRKEMENFPMAEAKIQASAAEEKKMAETRRKEYKRHTKSCLTGTSSNFFSKLALGIPATVATIGDASSVGLGLQDMEGEKLLGIIENSKVTSILIPAIYLLQNLAIYGSSTVESMQETIEIFMSGKLPEDWPIISNNCKKYIGEFVAALPAIYAAFSDAIASYYYINEQNWHPAFGALLGIFTAITSLFSEGVTSFKVILDQFADPKKTTDDETEEVKPEDPNSYVKMIVRLLGIVGGIEDALSSYVSIISTFSPESAILKNFFLAGSIGNGFCDFVFNNKIGIEAIDAFFTTLSQRLPHSSEILAFGLALFTGGLLGHIQRAFFITMIAAPEVALPFAIPQLLTSILGYGVAIRGGLNNMIGVFPLYNNIIRHVFGLKDTKEPKAIEMSNFFTSPTFFKEGVTLYAKIEIKEDYFVEKSELKKPDKQVTLALDEEWETLDKDDDEKTPFIKKL